MEILFFVILGILAGDLFVIAIMSINIWRELRGIKGWVTGLETCISKAVFYFERQLKRIKEPED